MNKAVVLFAATAFAFAAPAFAGTTPSVDSNYRVTGDAPAAPVQAFSVGSALYLQLHDTHEVPAPMGATGPIQYRIYGPYMILPVMPQVVLHYGKWTAYVTAGDASSQPSELATMTRPLDAIDHPVSEKPVAPTPSALLAPPPAASPMNADVVTGQISGLQGAAPVAPTFAVGSHTAPAGQGDALLAQVGDPRGRTIEIVADGTVAGAEAASKTQRSCAVRGWKCQVKYTGAPAGQVQMEIAQ